MAKKVTKRVAKSAKRVADGRPLPRKWIEQAVANYDPEKYAARINMEHMLSWHPESTFRIYGTVASLSTEEAENGELYLKAEIEPHPDLEAHWSNGQKRAFSIEIDPDFADIGGAYLTGLAVTDEPASLGTHFTSDPELTKQPRTQFYFDPADAGESNKQELTMALKSDKPASAKKPDPTETHVEQDQIPEAFSKNLEHFTSELTAVRTERDGLKTELAEEKATFKQQLEEKAQALTDATAEFATQKAALETQLTEKDAEIETLKGQVPHNNYKARPLSTGGESSESPDRPKARF